MVQRWQICLSATAFLGFVTKAKADAFAYGLTKIGQGIELSSLAAKDEATKAAREKLGDGLGIAGDVVETYQGISAGGDERAIATTKAGFKILALTAPGGPLAKVATDVAINVVVDEGYRQFVVEPRAERAYQQFMDRLDSQTEFQIQQAVAQREMAYAQIPRSSSTPQSTARVMGQGTSFSYLQTDLLESRARQTLEPGNCADMDWFAGKCEKPPEEPTEDNKGMGGWRLASSRTVDGAVTNATEADYPCRRQDEPGTLEELTGTTFEDTEYVTYSGREKTGDGEIIRSVSHGYHDSRPYDFAGFVQMRKVSPSRIEVTYYQDDGTGREAQQAEMIWEACQPAD